MQSLEVSGAVRYIYIIRRLKVKLRLCILRSLAHIMPLIKMEYYAQFIIGCLFLFVQKLHFLIQSVS
jgi:hypothetical protein